MKYIITKAECVTGSSCEVIKGIIETDSIEETRMKLHQVVKCDRILLTYEEAKKE